MGVYEINEIFVEIIRFHILMSLEQLKFPIGKYQKPDFFSEEIVEKYMADIASFPARLRKEVEHLSDEQLDTPYRPDGWTIRQVIHHCADSHMNALIRLKLALTEENPIIKPYREELWAESEDSKKMPIQPSLWILEGVHIRWTVLLTSLSNSDLKRKFTHPEHGLEFTLNENMGNYAWHCNHHLAHITTLKQNKTWI